MITLALIICIVGLLVYLLVDPALRGGRILECGRIMFFVGLLFVVAGYAGKALL